MNFLTKISPSICTSGKLNCKSGWVEAMRIIYEHQLVIFLEGDFIIEINGKDYYCPEKSFIIVPPDTVHVTRFLGNMRGCRFWVHFDWVYQGGFLDLPLITYIPGKVLKAKLHKPPAFIPHRIFQGTIDKNSNVWDVILRINQLWDNNDTHSRLICRGLFLGLLIELLDDSKAKNNKSENNLAERSRLLLEELAYEKHCDSNSIQYSLEKLGFTYAHQCRVFKKQYGITPLAFVNAIRMTRAKNLLRDTDLTISQVADELGFSNLSYFSKLFKKYTNLWPREFRVVNSKLNFGSFI